jgi:antitoxin (DNA-binding transcriptional repressor) of toxin-antitoxin stability system
MITISMDDMERDPLVCLRVVQAGETIVILQAGRPVMEIKPAGQNGNTRRVRPHRGPFMSKTTSRLKRPKHPMPDLIRAALEKNKLMDEYHSRPPCRQNDYVGWITRAKLPDTRQRRLNRMLDELRRGDVYMKMAYRPKSVGK